MTLATNASAVIERLVKAVRTGSPITALRLGELGLLSHHKCWAEAMRAVVEIDVAHPDAQMQFLKSWVRVEFAIMRGACDDDLFFAALRKLMPAYQGPPMTLYRGQRKGDPVGASWTRSLQIAVKFALYGTENVDPNALHRARVPPSKGGVVLVADNVQAEIISAPCLLGFQEGEFIVDPRRVSHRTLIDFGQRT
jgi:hypothetical protein